MIVEILLDGVAISESDARDVLSADALTNYGDDEEALAIFDRAMIPGDDGEYARDMLMLFCGAGLEVIIDV